MVHWIQVNIVFLRNSTVSWKMGTVSKKAWFWKCANSLMVGPMVGKVVISPDTLGAFETTINHEVLLWLMLSPLFKSLYICIYIYINIADLPKCFLNLWLLCRAVARDDSLLKSHATYRLQHTWKLGACLSTLSVVKRSHLLTRWGMWHLNCRRKQCDMGAMLICMLGEGNDLPLATLKCNFYCWHQIKIYCGRHSYGEFKTDWI